jgi:hypothetical protein
MKKLFWVLCIIASVSFLSWNNTAYAADKKPTTSQAKKIKKHKKAESTGKVADDKPAKSTPKKK